MRKGFRYTAVFLSLGFLYTPTESHAGLFSSCTGKLGTKGGKEARKCAEDAKKVKSNPNFAEAFQKKWCQEGKIAEADQKACEVLAENHTSGDTNSFITTVKNTAQKKINKLKNKPDQSKTLSEEETHIESQQTEAEQSEPVQQDSE